MDTNNLPPEAQQYLALVEAATPGPWKFEPGGGHAYNRISGSESVQISGWPTRVNGYSNASYSDRICENLGDIVLPAPKANVELIVNAPTAITRLCAMLADERALCDRLADSCKPFTDDYDAGFHYAGNTLRNAMNDYTAHRAKESK